MEIREAGVNKAMRAQYLRAMGIQTWFPRTELPGAKASPLPEAACVEEVLAESSAPATPEPGQPVTKRKASGVLRSEANVDQPAEKVPLTDETRSKRTEKADIPRFRLASSIYADQCLVLTDLSVDSDPQLSASQQRLMFGILNALGIKLHQPPKMTLFNWPMLRTHHVDQSESVAVDAVKAFLNAQLEGQRSIAFVLLMGEVAGRYLLPHEFELPNSRGKLWSVMEYPALMTHSLDRILEQPLLKREVWQDLQPLCRLQERL